MIKAKRFIVSFVLALVLGVTMTNAALAFDCTNPNLNAKAAVAKINVDTGEFIPLKPNWGYFTETEIKIHGGWVTLYSPSMGIGFNMWVHGVLPDGALNSGPGNNLCDNKGIDEFEACLAMFGS